MDSSGSRKVRKSSKRSGGSKSAGKTRETRLSPRMLRKGQSKGSEAQGGTSMTGPRTLTDRTVSSKTSRTRLYEYRGQGSALDIVQLGGGPSVPVESSAKYFTVQDPQAALQESGKTVAPEDDLKLLTRVAAIEAVLDGDDSVAHVLGISAEQLEATVLHDGVLDIGVVRRIIDLEFVVTRARLLYRDPELVNAWMRGKNSFLQGATPLDVVARDDLKAVIVALNQEMAGGLA